MGVDADALRLQAADYRKRAEEAKDQAVKDSLLLLAQICEEEADALARPKQ